MARAFLSVLFLLLLAAPAWAGPFGTEMGDPPSKFEGLEKYPGLSDFLTTTMPKNHSAFSRYALEFTEKNELSRVMALSEAFKNDPAGFRAQSVYSKLKTELSEKYGSPSKVTELLMGGSIWKDPVHFLRGIHAGERKHQCIWENPGADNLEKIVLMVITSNEKDACVGLAYEYTNFKSSKDKENKKDRDAL